MEIQLREAFLVWNYSTVVRTLILRKDGLSLRERDIFKLDAPDIGELFHAALKKIADKLLRENRTWADLSIKECEHLSVLVIEEIAPLLQRQILLSSNRHFYLKQKLQQIIFRTSIILREHAKSSASYQLI